MKKQLMKTDSISYCLSYFPNNKDKSINTRMVWHYILENFIVEYIEKSSVFHFLPIVPNPESI